MGLLSAVFGVSAPAVFAGTPLENEVYTLRRVSGRISSEGKGLEKVVVSDGFSVTQTDAKGNYVLEVHYDARFLFYTLPAGYEIPEEKGIARFYTPLKKGLKEQRADFNLVKAKQDDTRHTFVVWADTQIKTEEDAQKLLTISAPDAQAHIRTLKDRPVFGIGCGDLVWDNFDLFKDYREAVAMICATMMRLAIRPQITTTAIAVSGDTAILLVSASTALTLPFATEKKLRLKRNFCQRPNRNNFPA